MKEFVVYHLPTETFRCSDEEESILHRFYDWEYDVNKACLYNKEQAEREAKECDEEFSEDWEKNSFIAVHINVVQALLS